MMKYKIRIKDKDYSKNLVQGFTISDEFNETLDSGTVIIENVEKIKNLAPFDDVFIYGWDTRFIEFDFTGYPLPKDTEKRIKEKKFFYKHMLVNQFSSEITYLGDKEGNNILYNYTIELFSETKMLETIQLPNLSITQPVEPSKRKSIYNYLRDFLLIYNVKRKRASTNSKTFYYDYRYKLSEELIDIFGNVEAPQDSYNAPNLRDLLSKLFIVKDMIPYVKDDIIYAMNIGDKNKLGTFDITKGKINYISGSLSSSNYCTNLKRNYSNALSGETSTRSIEYVGFRNSNNAVLTLSDLQIELEHPIYKINKIYMCYYKKIKVNNVGKIFLCEQDITPLVKLDSERNALSKDWNDFTEALKTSYTLDELSQYKLCTVGYSIGSNVISGWGEKYSYPKIFWDVEKTYIENILTLLDSKYPFGSSNIAELRENWQLNPEDTIVVEGINLSDSLVNFEGDTLHNLSYNFKALTFKVDYQAFYNGSIINSKSFGDYNNDITINDNQSSSLTILEKDGINQNEKLNRFGNEGLQIKARYDNYQDVQDIGTIFNLGEDYKDIVIYHREMSMKNNNINVNYFGTKNYVLKNYYTSVFAKYRTYNLMSYAESTRRAENRKMYVYFSKNNLYYDNNKILNVDDDFLKNLISFFKTNYNYEDKSFNHSLINIKDYYIIKELMSFNQGNSLCFNIVMNDNITTSPYIDEFKPDANVDPKDNIVGSLQKYKMLTDEFGRIYNLNFIVGHVNSSEIVYIKNKLFDNNPSLIKDFYYNYLFKFPLLPRESNITVSNKIEMNNDLILKDNKELIDMTYQFEPITDEDSDIYFSDWMFKLTDFNSNYKKFVENKEINEFNNEQSEVTCYASSCYTGSELAGAYRQYYGIAILAIDNNVIVEGDTIDYTKSYVSQVYYNYSNNGKDSLDSRDRYYWIYGYILKIKKIYFDSESEITIDVDMNFMFKKYSWFNWHYYTSDNTSFTLKGSLCTITNPEENKKYFLFEIIPSNGVDFSYDNKKYRGISMGCGEFKRDDEEWDLNKIYSVEKLYYSSNEQLKKVIYYKNLYFVNSEKKLNNNSIYESFKELNDFIPINKNKVFGILNKNTGSFPIYTKGLKPGSLRCYYKNNSNDSKDTNDGNYYFVFGVNIEDKDINLGLINVYVSLIDDKDNNIYNDKNNIIGVRKNYKGNNEFNEINDDYFKLENLDKNDFLITPRIELDENGSIAIIYNDSSNAVDCDFFVGDCRLLNKENIDAKSFIKVNYDLNYNFKYNLKAIFYNQKNNFFSSNNRILEYWGERGDLLPLELEIVTNLGYCNFKLKVNNKNYVNNLFSLKIYDDSNNEIFYNDNYTINENSKDEYTIDLSNNSFGLNNNKFNLNLQIESKASNKFWNNAHSNSRFELTSGYIIIALPDGILDKFTNEKTQSYCIFFNQTWNKLKEQIMDLGREWEYIDYLPAIYDKDNNAIFKIVDGINSTIDKTGSVFENVKVIQSFSTIFTTNVNYTDNKYYGNGQLVIENPYEFSGVNLTYNFYRGDGSKVFENDFVVLIGAGETIMQTIDFNSVLNSKDLGENLLLPGVIRNFSLEFDGKTESNIFKYKNVMYGVSLQLVKINIEYGSTTYMNYASLGMTWTQFCNLYPQYEIYGYNHIVNKVNKFYFQVSSTSGQIGNTIGSTIDEDGTLTINNTHSTESLSDVAVSLEDIGNGDGRCQLYFDNAMNIIQVNVKYKIYDKFTNGNLLKVENSMNLNPEERSSIVFDLSDKITLEALNGNNGYIIVEWETTPQSSLPITGKYNSNQDFEIPYGLIYVNYENKTYSSKCFFSWTWSKLAEQSKYNSVITNTLDDLTIDTLYSHVISEKKNLYFAPTSILGSINLSYTPNSNNEINVDANQYRHYFTIGTSSLYYKYDTIPTWSQYVNSNLDVVSYANVYWYDDKIILDGNNPVKYSDLIIENKTYALLNSINSPVLSGKTVDSTGFSLRVYNNNPFLVNVKLYVNSTQNDAIATTQISSNSSYSFDNINYSTSANSFDVIIVFEIKNYKSQNSITFIPPNDVNTDKIKLTWKWGPVDAITGDRKKIVTITASEYFANGTLYYSTSGGNPSTSSWTKSSYTLSAKESINVSSIVNNQSATYYFVVYNVLGQWTNVVSVSS